MDNFDAVMLITKKIIRDSPCFRSISNNLKNKNYVINSCSNCPFKSYEVGQACQLICIMRMYHIDSIEFREKLKINELDFCTGLTRKLVAYIPTISFSMDVE